MPSPPQILTSLRRYRLFSLLCFFCGFAAGILSIRPWHLAALLRRQDRPPPPPPASPFSSSGCLPKGSLAGGEGGKHYLEIRKLFVWPHIRGRAGIEVGALQQPFAVPPDTTVRYVDSKSIADLRAVYPELQASPLVAPDVIDTIETLGKFGDESEDFVLASHVIEHAENPLGAIKNMLRVLRPGGVLALVAPMRCETFDRERGLTLWSHMLAEFEDSAKPAANRVGHYAEWLRSAGNKEDEAALRAAATAAMTSGKFSIHYHVVRATC